MATNKISLELAGGIKILNPDPVDPRFRVTNVTSAAVKGDKTMYIGFGPIFSEHDGKIYFVDGDANNNPSNPSWTFKDIGDSAIPGPVGPPGPKGETNLIADDGRLVHIFADTVASLARATDYEYDSLTDAEGHLHSLNNYAEHSLTDYKRDVENAKLEALAAIAKATEEALKLINEAKNA